MARVLLFAANLAGSKGSDPCSSSRTLKSYRIRCAQSEILQSHGERQHV